MPPTPEEIKQMNLMKERIQKAEKSTGKNAEETKTKQERLLKVYKIQQENIVRRAQEILLERLERGEAPLPLPRLSLGKRRLQMNNEAKKQVALRYGEFTI